MVNHTIQKCQCAAQIDEHILDQHGLSRQLMHTIPEPIHNEYDARQKYGLQCQPNFCETTILVNNRQMNIVYIANVEIHSSFRIDRQTNVQ